MLKIDCVPAFSDNYLWLIHTGGSTAWVVDPGDATPILEALAARDLTLAGILITHHHPDHIGGVATLTARYDVPVYGPRSIPGECVSHPVAENDEVAVFGHRFRVIEVPGHTLDHIAYYLAPGPDSDAPILLCGDTLFAGGCGRVFEGTFAMMHASLQKLAGLPAATRIYCAHEYTLANLKFAQAVEPNNQALAERVRHAQQQRSRDEPTVPSILAIEGETNPFLRCAEPDVRRAAAQHSGRNLDGAEATFEVLRQWKDNF